MNFDQMVWTQRPFYDDNDQPRLGPVVWVSVPAIDASWRQDTGYYVGLLGSGSDLAYRYARFGTWFASRLHRPIEVPVLALDGGEVTFTDGRHRFAWLRDHGLLALPVEVSAGDHESFETRFATPLRIGRLQLPEL